MHMEKSCAGGRTKSGILAFLLVMYIYIPFWWNIIENTFSVSFLYEYILYALLAVAACVVAQRISRKILIFLACFGAGIILNCIFVTYRWYVLVEGLQALLGVAVPCLCIANDIFDLRIFIEKWWKFSKYSLPLVLISVLLLKKELVSYSVFTGLCVPNVFIASYMLADGIKKRSWLYFNALCNIAVTAFFGGRTSAVVAAAMLLFAVMYSKRVALWKKAVLFLLLVGGACILLINLTDILYWISDKLAQYGIQSRSIRLLIEQLKTKEIYLTNRDSIYDVCITYIKERLGAPGGFGVALNLTEGKYYYTHNILLQFLTMFGIGGTILAVAGILVRYQTIRWEMTTKGKRFIGFLAGAYCIIGMAGSSIWIHYLSTIFIAIYFGGDKRLYQSIENQRTVPGSEQRKWDIF